MITVFNVTGWNINTTHINSKFVMGDNTSPLGVFIDECRKEIEEIIHPIPNNASFMTYTPSIGIVYLLIKAEEVLDYREDPGVIEIMASHPILNKNNVKAISFKRSEIIDGSRWALLSFTLNVEMRR